MQQHQPHPSPSFLAASQSNVPIQSTSHVTIATQLPSNTNNATTVTTVKHHNKRTRRKSKTSEAKSEHRRIRESENRRIREVRGEGRRWGGGLGREGGRQRCDLEGRWRRKQSISAAALRREAARSKRHDTKIKRPKKNNCPFSSSPSPLSSSSPPPPPFSPSLLRSC